MNPKLVPPMCWSVKSLEKNRALVYEQEIVKVTVNLRLDAVVIQNVGEISCRLDGTLPQLAVYERAIAPYQSLVDERHPDPKSQQDQAGQRQRERFHRLRVSSN